MKLAASNIGWDPERRREVLTRLPVHGVSGVVIAPTMVFAEGPYADRREVNEFRKEVEERGLAIAGLQSLTFGLTNAALFGGESERQNLTEHLKRQAELGGALGARSLIFGSPGLRQQVGEYEQAVDIFRSVAEVAVDNGTKLTIEPLSGYGNQFVTNSVEGVSLVQNVGSEGFGLHLDAAALAGAHEGGVAIHDASMTVGITSFDASASELMPLSLDETVNHRLMARALRAAEYSGYISLEMRQPEGTDPVERFFSEVDFMRDQYAA